MIFTYLLFLEETMRGRRLALCILQWIVSHYPGCELGFKPYETKKIRFRKIKSFFVSYYDNCVISVQLVSKPARKLISISVQLH